MIEFRIEWKQWDGHTTATASKIKSIKGYHLPAESQMSGSSGMQSQASGSGDGETIGRGSLSALIRLRTKIVGFHLTRDAFLEEIQMIVI